jgi:hypothetical protein
VGSALAPDQSLLLRRIASLGKARLMPGFFYARTIHALRWFPIRVVTNRFNIYRLLTITFECLKHFLAHTIGEIRSI